MGACALLSGIVFRTIGLTEVGLVSLGALTSQAATGPFLDLALRRTRGGWRLYAAFALAGLSSNMLAFAVRGGSKLAGLELGGRRSLVDWFLQAVVTYPVCGLLAGLLSGALWFYGSRRETQNSTADEAARQWTCRERDMIWIGIDDTDVLDSRGTNQLAKLLVNTVRDNWRCVRIVRHQLLDDPRVPYTSKNGSASIALEPVLGTGDDAAVRQLIDVLRAAMLADFIPGSDPGLCVATRVSQAVIGFGKQCQTQLVTQEEARQLAAEEGLFLEGLGGTEGGVIGALAAVGLAATLNDGRVVQMGNWPDDLCGMTSVAALAARNVLVRDYHTGQAISLGRIDLGKKLRPNLRDGRHVLFVQPQSEPTGVPVNSIQQFDEPAYGALKLL